MPPHTHKKRGAMLLLSILVEKKAPKLLQLDDEVELLIPQSNTSLISVLDLA